MSAKLLTKVKYRDEVFEVETRDSSNGQKTIISSIFLENNLLISKNVSYSKLAEKKKINLKKIIKIQHLKIISELKDGKFLKFMSDEPVEIKKKDIPELSEPELNSENKIEEDKMVIKEILAVLEDVSGYMGSGVFTPQGEMLDGSSEVSGISFEQSGSLIHDILNKSKSLTGEAGFGDMHMIQMYTEMGIIFAVCSEENDQHFHTILVINNNGNVAMGKLKLEKVVTALKTAI